MKRSDIPLFHKYNEQLTHFVADTFIILFIKQGNTAIRINEQRYPLTSPSIICFNDNERATLLCENCVTESVSFLPSFINSNFTTDTIKNRKSLKLQSSDMDLYMLNPFIKRTENKLPYIQLGPESIKRVTNYFDRIASELSEQRDKYWPCRTRGIFMELLFFIESQNALNLKQDPLQLIQTNDPLVEQVILTINSNYAEEITIDSLSKECAINRTTLSKRFKEATGCTITNYLIRVRVQLASMMLKETYMPITEIMYNTGFNTTANFNRYFKKYTSCTPSEYRNRSKTQ